jgi:hypothetical protein
MYTGALGNEEQFARMELSAEKAKLLSDARPLNLQAMPA